MRFDPSIRRTHNPVGVTPRVGSIPTSGTFFQTTDAIFLRRVFRIVIFAPYDRRWAAERLTILYDRSRTSTDS